ncbi:Tetratricopeptide repeat protein 12 [Grifola frondosa]|uniref:Tetratricopeptide repeat protein 12 n=1 Tax=Grifola frondosa TaxID=5627 RepID=A0A1C7MIQ0_GRIFR|nr:Tetratricopeptide repeat protein 12 [Grifola frondosa]
MSSDELRQYADKYRAWFDEDLKIAPGPAPFMNRTLLVSEQAASRRYHETRKENGSYWTYTGLAKHYCSTSVLNLERITFSNMSIRKTHIGRFLLCRIITPCVRLVAISTVVEDTDGLVQNLSMYNFPTTIGCSLDHLDKLFPIGTVIAIREPTLKAPLSGPRPLVRVDSPTDIVFIEPRDPILRDITWRTRLQTVSLAIPDSVEGWKERGDAYFKASEWLPAAIAYSRGLRLNSEAVVLRLNRSEAFLRLRYYSGALCDMRYVLQSADIPEGFLHKALFRGAKAEYARGNFDAALASFLRCLEIRPEEQSLIDWISRTRSRQVESTGQYDWVSLFRMAREDIHLDVADYQGPVKVRPMAHRGGGRGIVATKNVEVGELLLVSKPFIAIYDSDVPKGETFIALDLLSKRINSSTRHTSLLRTIEKIYGNPETHDLVYHLYAGPDFPCPSDSYPPMTSPQPSPVDPLVPHQQNIFGLSRLYIPVHTPEVGAPNIFSCTPHLVFGKNRQTVPATAPCGRRRAIGARPFQTGAIPLI